MLKNLLKIAEGSVLLLHALFSEPKTSVPLVLKGIGRELGALALNCLNIVASLGSFVARTLSTIFNFGYLSSNVQPIFDSLDESFGRDRNSVSEMGLFGGFFRDALEQAFSFDDRTIMNDTFSF